RRPSRFARGGLQVVQQAPKARQRRDQGSRIETAAGQGTAGLPGGQGHSKGCDQWQDRRDVRAVGEGRTAEGGRLSRMEERAVEGTAREIISSILGGNFFRQARGRIALLHGTWDRGRSNSRHLVAGAGLARRF